MDRYVIGQDEAKKIISVASYTHYKRVNHNTSRKAKEEQARQEKRQMRCSLTKEKETKISNAMLQSNCYICVLM